MYLRVSIGRKGELKMVTVEPIRDKRDIKKVELILKKQSLRNALIFLIGINCGLRISDILNLNVGDVKDKHYIQIIEQKTNKPKRVPINLKLKPIVEEFTIGRNIEEPLFLTVFKNRMERTSAYRIIRKACKLANIQEKVGTHTMRKTFGYHHYQKFRDVVILQKNSICV